MGLLTNVGAITGIIMIFGGLLFGLMVFWYYLTAILIISVPAIMDVMRKPYH